MGRFIAGVILMLIIPFLAYKFAMVPIIGGILICVAVVTFLIGLAVVKGVRLPDN